MKKAKILEFFSDTFSWVPAEATTTIFSAVALPKKVCMRMLSIRLQTYSSKKTSVWLQVATTYLRMVKKAYFDHSHAWATLKVPKQEIG